MSLSKEIKMKKEIESFRHETLLNVIYTANHLEKMADSFFRPFGMSGAQYNILIVLKLEGRGLTQVDIGERVVSSRSNITALIDRLEKKGYVERREVEEDRRIYEVHLTKKGLKAVSEAEKPYIEEVEKVMSGFNKSECCSLSSLLEKLRNNLGK